MIIIEYLKSADWEEIPPARLTKVLYRFTDLIDRFIDLDSN